MATQILRLQRTDKPKQHLLVHVHQTRVNTLDLKLIGTEHEHLYHASIKESNIKTLQASNYSGDLDQWKDIIRYALLHEHPSKSSDDLEGLEIVAAINGTTLTVTLRKNIGGITQRLGSIKLDQDDEKEEVSAFEWVDSAVTTSDELRNQLRTLQASVSGQQDQVTQLTKQLDDLVEAKKEHEEELLKKFTVLLNSKKLKIRDQQRLINAAKIDIDVANATSEARKGRSAKGRSAKGSRGGKRKAGDEHSEDDGEMDDGNGLEAVEDYEERQDEQTPPPTDDEDADDDDLDAPGPSTSGKAGEGKASESMDIDEPQELPPRRELPFNKKAAPPSKQAPAAPAEEDDETDDDEL